MVWSTQPVSGEAVRVPPKSVPSYWIRVVARGVGCAVKYSTFISKITFFFKDNTAVSAGRRAVRSQPEEGENCAAVGHNLISAPIHPAQDNSMERRG